MTATELQRPTSPTKPSSRLLYVDMLRILACFLVIFTHSAMPSDQSRWVFLAAISFIGSPSSELFLSLSGAVLLPVKTGFKAFYRRRFLKLVPPVFFWSIIVMILYWVLSQQTAAETIEKILFIPLKPVIGVYWFVYVMAGLYLFAPFISKWLASSSRKQVELFFIIWGINLILPYIDLFMPGKFTLNDSHYWALNYFGGFLGYWLLGYYLRMYPIKIGTNFRWIFILCGCIAYALIVVMVKLMVKTDVTILIDNLQAGSAFMVAMLYTLAQHIHIKSQRLTAAINDVAKTSFGIYLIHIFIIREFVWRLFENCTINPILLTIIISVLSMAICWAIIKAISYLPGSKYIVGV